MKRKSLLDKDGEVRELTLADMRRFKSAQQVIPHIVQAHRAGKPRLRGRPKSSQKMAIGLRLDNELIAALRSSGSGRQTRVNDLLKAVIEVNSSH